MKKKWIITAIVAGAFIAGSASFVLAIGLLLPSTGSINASMERDHYVEVAGSRIRYRENNRKETPVVVMLHGFGGNLSDWEKLAGEMPYAKAISLDLIGFGLSDKPSIDYSLETQRKYLIAFLDKMNIQKAVLVGTSMGSSIALWAAAKSPERVAGLVVFAPSAYPDSMHHKWPGDVIYRPGIPNRILRGIAGTKLFRACFPKSLVRQAMDITASYGQSFADSLSSIQQPVLLIWSRGDKRAPFSYNEQYRELLPNVTFLEAPQNLGHYAASHPTPEIHEGIQALVLKATY